MFGYLLPVIFFVVFIGRQTEELSDQWLVRLEEAFQSIVVSEDGVDGIEHFIESKEIGVLRGLLFDTFFTIDDFDEPIEVLLHFCQVLNQEIDVHFEVSHYLSESFKV